MTNTAPHPAIALAWRKKMSTAPSPVPLSFFSSTRSCNNEVGKGGPGESHLQPSALPGSPLTGWLC